MYIYIKVLETPSLGNGHRMAIVALTQHTGSNLETPSQDLEVIKFGKHMQKINARYSPRS
jgi:hypothetical protein